MANIIGTIKELGEIMCTLEDCNILCGDGGICGDALDDRYCCEDCNGIVLGMCLHPDEKYTEFLEEKCTNCRQCEWLF